VSTLNVATVKSLNTLPPAVQNSSGTEIGTFCRAWVNFNGTGTVAIRASFNVSSITDNGTGDYTVNFTTAMSDANYSVSSVSMRNDVSGASSNGVFSVVFGSTTYADAMKTGSVRIECKLTTSNVDPLAAFVSIFR
jgi:hypothetical protein